MRTMASPALGLAVALCLGLGGARASAGSEPEDSIGPVLFYRQPAKEWVEALPIGNGRLGGMVFGGVPAERVQLNEDTFWSGGPYDPVNDEALPYLEKVRQLVREGRYKEAQDLADEKLMGRPRHLQAYQPLGDLRIVMDGHGQPTDYRRELDLALRPPVRTLPAHREQPPGQRRRQPAPAQPARGRATCRASGTTPDARLGQQVHDQHQHRDELLAGRGDEPRRVPRAAVRPGRGAARAGANGARSTTAAAASSPTTTPTSGARRRADRRRRNWGCGRPAARGSACTCGSTTRSAATAAFLRDRAYPSSGGARSSSSTSWCRTRTARW
jgi:hypothetical protein